ncbi:unnamed protein product, partial [Amoebophrya sp. A120]
KHLLEQLHGSAVGDKSIKQENFYVRSCAAEKALITADEKGNTVWHVLAQFFGRNSARDLNKNWLVGMLLLRSCSSNSTSDLEHQGNIDGTKDHRSRGADAAKTSTGSSATSTSPKILAATPMNKMLPSVNQLNHDKWAAIHLAVRRNELDALRFMRAFADSESSCSGALGRRGAAKVNGEEEFFSAAGAGAVPEAAEILKPAVIFMQGNNRGHGYAVAEQVLRATLEQIRIFELDTYFQAVARQRAAHHGGASARASSSLAVDTSTTCGSALIEI